MISFRASRFCVLFRTCQRGPFFLVRGSGIQRLHASIFDIFGMAYGMAYGISRICSSAFLGIGMSGLPSVSPLSCIL